MRNSPCESEPSRSAPTTVRTSTCVFASSQRFCEKARFARSVISSSVSETVAWVFVMIDPLINS